MSFWTVDTDELTVIHCEVFLGSVSTWPGIMWHDKLPYLMSNEVDYDDVTGGHCDVIDAASKSADHKRMLSEDIVHYQESFDLNPD